MWLNIKETGDTEEKMP